MEEVLATCISIGLAIVGIGLAIYFYLRSKKEKKPNIRMKSFNIFGESIARILPDTIEVTYWGDPIQNLTVTNIAFWNAGKEPIRWEDVAEQETLEIFPRNEFQILSASIIQANNDAANVQFVDANEDEVVFKFDFLEQDDGAVFQIFHTGQKDSDLTIRGKIIGATIDYGKPTTKFRKWVNNNFSFVAYMALLAILVTVLLVFKSEVFGYVFFPIFFVLAIAVQAREWFSGRRKRPPQSLDMFERFE
jgi:hypothetical protein